MGVQSSSANNVKPVLRYPAMILARTARSSVSKFSSIIPQHLDIKYSKEDKWIRRGCARECFIAHLDDPNYWDIQDNEVSWLSYKLTPY